MSRLNSSNNKKHGVTRLQWVRMIVPLFLLLCSGTASAGPESLEVAIINFLTKGANHAEGMVRRQKATCPKTGGPPGAVAISQLRSGYRQFMLTSFAITMGTGALDAAAELVPLLKAGKKSAKAYKKARDAMKKLKAAQAVQTFTASVGSACPGDTAKLIVTVDLRSQTVTAVVEGNCQCANGGRTDMKSYYIHIQGKLNVFKTTKKLLFGLKTKTTYKFSISRTGIKVGGACCDDKKQNSAYGAYRSPSQSGNQVALPGEEATPEIDCSKVDCKRLSKEGQSAADTHKKLRAEAKKLQAESNKVIDALDDLDAKLDKKGISKEDHKKQSDKLKAESAPGGLRLNHLKTHLMPILERDLRLYCAQWKKCKCGDKTRTVPAWVIEWCSKPGYGLYIPSYGGSQGEPVSYGYSAIDSDSSKWCSYGTTVTIPLVPGSTPNGVDQPGGQPVDGGTPIPISTGKTGTPKGSDKPRGTPQGGTTDPPSGSGTPIVSVPPKKDEPKEKKEPPTVIVTIFVKTKTDTAGKQSVAVTGAMLRLNLGTIPALPNTKGAKRDVATGANQAPIVAQPDANGMAKLNVPVAYLPGGKAPAQPIQIAMTTPEGKIVKIDPVKGNDPKSYLAAGLMPYMASAIALKGSLFVVLQYPKTQAALVSQLIDQSSNVIRIQINYCRDKQVKLNDPFFNSKGTWGQSYADQWGIKRVGYTAANDSAWSLLSNKRTPIVVAVIDTGIDWNHKDFSWNNLWTNTDEVPDNGKDDDRNGYIDDVIGWDFMGNTNKPWDRDGHGTFVSGIIAATQNNGVGIAGIDPSARIMVLKALNNFGHTRASYIAQALIYAADNGARVINLSVGGKHQTELEQEAINYAHSKGAVIVVAAGNEAVDLKDYGPASHSNVITVAATDDKNRRTNYSNWGAGVDIAAPGTDILGLRARRSDLMFGIPDYKTGAAFVGTDRRYFRTSGTSFSAPIVSGTASLLLSNNPSLTNQQVKRMLLHSAKDIEVTGVDQHTGYGLLDARRAMQASPNYFVEARIVGMSVIQKDGKTFVQVNGVATADRFKQAWLELGEGEDPSSWKKVASDIEASVDGDVLGDIDANNFQGATVWILRLTTQHEDESIRQFLFRVNLG